jgi:hypothetical protein
MNNCVGGVERSVTVIDGLQPHPLPILLLPIPLATNSVRAYAGCGKVRMPQAHNDR